MAVFNSESPTLGTTVIQASVNGDNPLVIKNAEGTTIHTIAHTGNVTPTGNLTIAANKTLAVTTADKLTVGGTIIGTTFSFSTEILASTVAKHVWIAPRACKVVSVKEIHSVVGGAAAACRPRKITDTSAPGAVAGATVKEITQANFDCTAVINTTQTGTLSATAADYTFAAGDKLALNVSGTLTGLVGQVTFEFQAV